MENFLGIMKRLVRAKHHPLQQIHRRLEERSQINISVNPTQSILDLKSVNVNGCKFRMDSRNCYFMKMGKFYEIVDIINLNGSQSLKCRKIIPLNSCLFEYPMFNLVKFLGEVDSEGSVPCEIVPKSWLTDNNQSCWWPSGLNGYSKAFPKAIPKKTWKECENIVVKFASDSLEELKIRRRRYLINLETSNVESESEIDISHTKARCSGKRPTDPNSSSDDDDLSLPNPPVPPKMATPIVVEPIYAPNCPVQSTRGPAVFQSQAEDSQFHVVTTDGNYIEIVPPSGITNDSSHLAT
ncbi:unnamed protein product, partial [Allacma fusca]